MKRRRRPDGPSLGDVASEFKAKWEAGKTVDRRSPGKQEQPRDTVNDQRWEETLHSWKRGGGPVKVTRGPSRAEDHRKKKCSARPSPTVSPGRATPAAPPLMPSLGVTSSPSHTKVTAPTLTPPACVSWKDRLADVSADVRELKISGARAKPRSIATALPVQESAAGKRAILGLDFGTAFTKAVVNWSGRYHAVDWSDVVEAEDRYLLASVFSESPDGACVLGALEEAGWSIRDGIKLSLLSSDGDERPEVLADAVIFIALAFRFVDSWLRKQDRTISGGIRWRLHLGLPTESWDRALS